MAWPHGSATGAQSPDVAKATGFVATGDTAPATLDSQTMQYTMMLQAENARLRQRAQLLEEATRQIQLSMRALARIGGVQRWEEAEVEGMAWGERLPGQFPTVAAEELPPLPMLLGPRFGADQREDLLAPPPGLPVPPGLSYPPGLEPRGDAAAAASSAAAPQGGRAAGGPPSTRLAAARAVPVQVGAEEEEEEEEEHVGLATSPAVGGDTCLRIMAGDLRREGAGVHPTHVVEWRIEGLRAKLRVSNGFPLLSPPFQVGDFPSLRLMFVPGDRWASYAGARMAARRPRRRQAEAPGGAPRAGAEGPPGGSVKVKAAAAGAPGGLLRFRLCVGAARQEGVVQCNFAEHAVHGSDIEGDWRDQVEGDGDCLRLRLEIL